MKRILYFATVAILLLIICNVALSIFALWSKKDVLTAAQQQLVKEQKEHVAIQHQLAQTNSFSFIEQQARDKLFLGKPGDSLVLFPTASPSGAPASSGVSIPVWRAWWKLFF